MSVNHIAGEEIKLTDYLSRHPNGKAETEINYEEEYVINAILPLLGLSKRTNGIIKTNRQNSTNQMTDASQEQSSTSRSHPVDEIRKTLKTNRQHSTNQMTDTNQEQNSMPRSHPVDEVRKTLTGQTTNTKIIQSDINFRKQSVKNINFEMDRNMHYNWGATPEIMRIINNRDNSPETQKLVDRRIEIVKPGSMRVKRDNQGAEHWVPRRPDANGRKEVVEIDIRLGVRNRRKQKTPETERQEQLPSTSSSKQKHESDTETIIIGNPTGSLYPTINTKEFGDEPAQIIEYLQINKVVGIPNKKSTGMEDNLGDSEMKFMTDLRSLIKETNRDRDLIATIIGLENRDESSIPENYSRQCKQLNTRWGIVFLDDRIIIPTGMRDSVLNALHFGHPGESKMLADSKIFWWPGHGRRH